MTDRRGPAVVLKFGGATLRHPGWVIRQIARAARRPGGLVVVVSARAGVTDRLERSTAPPRGSAAHAELLRSLRREHPGRATGIPEVLARLRRDLGAVRRVRGNGRRTAPAEAVRAAGERLAVRWLVARLRARGLPADPVDADVAGLRVAGPRGAPRIDLRRSRPALRQLLGGRLRAGRIPIVTGYFGRGGHGPRTLGRGGSDYSAVALGAILRAGRVELVKSDGPIRSADPRWVRHPRALPALDYATADALARTDARVLHPAAIALARRRRLRLAVRDLRDRFPATRIGPVPSRGAAHAILSVRAGARLVPLPREALRNARRRSSAVSESELAVATFPSPRGRLGATFAGRLGRNGPGTATPRRGGGVDPRGARPITLVTTVGLSLAMLQRVQPEIVRRHRWGSASGTGFAVLALPGSNGRRTIERLDRELVSALAAGPAGGGAGRTEALFSRRFEGGRLRR